MTISHLKICVLLGAVSAGVFEANADVSSFRVSPVSFGTITARCPTSYCSLDIPPMQATFSVNVTPDVPPGWTTYNGGNPKAACKANFKGRSDGSPGASFGVPMSPRTQISFYSIQSTPQVSCGSISQTKTITAQATVDCGERNLGKNLQVSVPWTEQVQVHPWNYSSVVTATGPVITGAIQCGCPSGLVSNGNGCISRTPVPLPSGRVRIDMRRQETPVIQAPIPKTGPAHLKSH